MASFSVSSERKASASTLRALFAFLSDFRNFVKVLPADKIDGFKATESGCTFNIKGITSLSVTIAEKVFCERIVYESSGLSKFNFTLTAEFEGEESSTGLCSVKLVADLNPFIRAMAEKPLADLVNVMCTKMAALELPDTTQPSA